MTQWRTPGEPPRPPARPGVSDASAQPTGPARPGGSPQPSRPPPKGPAARSQWIVLAVAGAFIVAAIVLLVVVLAGGNDSTAGARPGSADAVTDRLAAALHAGSVGQVRALTCAGGGPQVLAAARPAFGASATRQGTAKIQATVGVGQISLAGTVSARSATVGLRRVGTQWCVASLVAGG